MPDQEKQITLVTIAKSRTPKWSHLSIEAGDQPCVFNTDAGPGDGVYELHKVDTGAKIGSLRHAVNFLDLARKESKYGDGSLVDAHNWLESAARELLEIE